MVLKVATDFRHVDQAINAGGLEYVVRADARAHQQGRTFQRPGAQHHLIRRDFERATLPPHDFEATHLIAVQGKPPHQRSRQDGQVFAASNSRREPGIGHGYPLPVVNVQRVRRDANHLSAVVAFKARQAE